MKALSIKQPWALLIVKGGKDIENRSWPLPSGLKGQRIYVHASKTFDIDAHLTRQQVLAIDNNLPNAKEEFWNIRLADYPVGAIIGEVTITGCVRFSRSPWFCGPYGFVLADPLAYDKPIPYRGQLGFFDVSLPPRRSQQ